MEMAEGSDHVSGQKSMDQKLGEGARTREEAAVETGSVDYQATHHMEMVLEQRKREVGEGVWRTLVQVRTSAQQCQSRNHPTHQGPNPNTVTNQNLVESNSVENGSNNNLKSDLQGDGETTNTKHSTGR